MKPYFSRDKKRISVSDNPISYDIWLIIPVLCLVGIGIVMVYSASSALAAKKFGVDYYYLKRQAISFLLGVVALVICRCFPIKIFRSLTYPILALAAFFLIAIVITDLGVSAGGAVRWIGFGHFTFQPVELARFAIILYLAYSMSKKGEKIRRFSIGFVPHIIILAGFSFLIMLQPDFGSVMILFLITWIMLFIGGVPVKHLILSIIPVAPVVYFFLISSPYRLKRITSFLDPWKYASNEGYQTIHSLMAFGTGKIWGAGLGKGYQKLFYLPEPHTDFIFSVIGEELGFVGVLGVLACFGLIIWKGIEIAINTEDRFSSFLAAGITISIGLQATINMGVAMALLPTKGLTLPFLSYGGTSLLINMASVGILMNIGARRLNDKAS